MVLRPWCDAASPSTDEKNISADTPRPRGRCAVQKTPVSASSTRHRAASQAAQPCAGLLRQSLAHEAPAPPRRSNLCSNRTTELWAHPWARQSPTESPRPAAAREAGPAVSKPASGGIRVLPWRLKLPSFPGPRPFFRTVSKPRGFSQSWIVGDRSLNYKCTLSAPFSGSH